MEIADIKSSLSLADVLQHYGLKPDKHARLNCPFHPDKTPSLQVYYKTQTCYCFSANCSTHGKSLDVIDFPAAELYAMPAATSAFLDDAAVDVGQWIAEEVNAAFAEQVFIGTGAIHLGGVEEGDAAFVGGADQGDGL